MNESSGMNEQAMILDDENGHSHSVHILRTFVIDRKEYALLHNLNSDGHIKIVVMELVSQDDQRIFRTINDDNEFNRVVGYVRDHFRE
jgi:uncharacterized protein YrzB (UPF0473 family)